MIGLLVRDTIALRRAYDCEHDWQRYNETEEQCNRCLVIVTPAGKENLAKATERFFGRPRKARP